MILIFDPKSLWETRSKSKIIQIYGRAGSGKSTLAMHFVRYILEDNPNSKVFWIDTERKTTSKRLEQTVGKYTRSMFISQPNTYQNQEETIRTLSNLTIPLTGVVVDTISHHFRGLENEGSWFHYSEKLLAFYENQILPLLIFQERMDCYLLLLHQVTSVPNEGDKPFMHKIFDEISSSWIYLSC